MKNKKFLAIAAGLCLFATVGYANNYLISGLGFVAPSIIGKSNIYNPQVGEIVYDSVDGTFYGYDQNNQWQTLNAGANTGVPVGVIQAFGGATAPAGYLICDGRAVSRTTYANLYAAIGDAFGEGDGVNTFNLPDLRGRFLRGVDDGAGRDPGNRTVMKIGNNPDAPGSFQDDSFRGHWHNSYYNSTAQGGSASYTNSATAPTTLQPQVTVRGAVTDGVNGTPRISSETRPKNVNVNYIIKI